MGVGIEIKPQDSAALDYLEVLRVHMGDITTPLSEIGEALLISTEQRFDDQKSPEGVPWAPLSPGWLAVKEAKGRNPDKILTFYGDLRGSIQYQIEGDDLVIGTPKVYGPIHQFGGMAGRGTVTSSRSGGSTGGALIEARPYLGLSDADEAEILDILMEYFRG